MSGFISRWARRKTAAAVMAAPSPEPEVAEIDPASLPPIETLSAGSDFTAFLAQGVSASLQTQALKIAWEGDPQIASFRGMAEYAWDFNAEGYGQLAAGDDVAALLRGITGAFDPPEAEPMAVAQVEASESPSDAESVPTAEPEHKLAPPEPNAVPQADACAAPVSAPIAPLAIAARRHGGALPV
jgi:hypothetical protein